MLKVLFICTGNTCRSPMAEHLFRSEISKANLTYQVSVSSAGLAAFPGEKASDIARQILAAENISMDDHRSVALDKELIESADLILTMTLSHLRQLVSSYPQAKGKTFLLKEFAELSAHNKDIADPLGGGLEKYQFALEDIRTSIKKIIHKFKEGFSGENSNRQ